jgi:thiosulfate/3-mercaptopyruvate sulfurtransferase
MMPRFAALLLAALTLFAQGEPWKPADLMPPAELAARLNSASPKPVILYVGFPVLYRSSRIPGAVLAGPMNRPEGLTALKQAVAGLPKDKEVVIYCGCCPFAQCPNIRPGFRALREMGFTKVRLVDLPTNLSSDWVAKGYPTDKPGVK